MPNINIRVKNKIATADRTIYVCGNSDYVAVFDFDSEWDAYETKTARFSYGGQYTDVVFTGNQCQIPVITNTFSFNVGVFAGDLHTTTSAYVSCRKSILCGNGTPAAPTEDVYSQIMELLNEAGTVDPAAIADAVQAYLTANPVEAPVTSVNDKTGAVTLTADDVEAMRGKVVSNWDSGNNGDDVYEIIFNYDIGVVQSAPATVFGDSNSAPVLVLVGNQWYGNKDFTAIDRHGRTWYGVCKLSDPSISTFSVHYPTPEEIGAATPDDVTQAAQEAVEASKALGMTGAEVGQIAKITAVDDSGVPTAWEAVDMPSGGGSGGSGDQWELLAEFDTSTAEVFQQDFDAPMKKLYIELSASDTAGELYNASKTAYRSVSLNVEGSWKVVNMLLGMCSHSWGYHHIIRLDTTDAFTWGEYANTLSNYSTSMFMFPTRLGNSAQYLTGHISGIKVTQTLPEDTTNESTGTIKVCGVRA